MNKPNFIVTEQFSSPSKSHERRQDYKELLINESPPGRRADPSNPNRIQTFGFGHDMTNPGSVIQRLEKLDNSP